MNTPSTIMMRASQSLLYEGMRVLSRVPDVERRCLVAIRERTTRETCDSVKFSKREPEGRSTNNWPQCILLKRQNLSSQKAVEKLVQDRGLASRDIKETTKARVPYDLKLIGTAKDDDLAGNTHHCLDEESLRGGEEVNVEAVTLLEDESDCRVSRRTTRRDSRTASRLEKSTICRVRRLC
ncbi:hypothetical protein YC2023_094043 [Brassica napus]